VNLYFLLLEGYKGENSYCIGWCGDAIVSIGIGRGSLVAVFHLHRHAGQGLTVGIAYGTADVNALGKNGAGSETCYDQNKGKYSFHLLLFVVIWIVFGDVKIFLISRCVNQTEQNNTL